MLTCFKKNLCIQKSGKNSRKCSVLLPVRATDANAEHHKHINKSQVAGKCTSRNQVPWGAAPGQGQMADPACGAFPELVKAGGGHWTFALLFFILFSTRESLHFMIKTA